MRLLTGTGAVGHRLAGFPDNRLAEVPDTVELVVAPDWTEARNSGRLTLRLRPWYTGSTYWLSGWDGSGEVAEAWIDQVVELQAANVEGDRRHGPTLWDDQMSLQRDTYVVRLTPAGWVGLVFLLLVGGWLVRHRRRRPSRCR